MSSSYRDDEDQLQLVKNWLREYGLVTVIAIALAIAIVLGWQYWLRYQVGKSEKASATYQQMAGLVLHNKRQEAITSADILIQHYPSTPYAVLASLWLAKDQVIAKDLNSATDHLNWAVKHSKDKALNNIITLRLAKLALAQKKPDQALKLLQGLKGGGYEGIADEVRGDISYSQGKRVDAKRFWQKALKALSVANADYTEVQYKLANLPVEVSGEKK